MAGIKDIRKGLGGTFSKIIVGSIIVTFSLFFGWGTVFSSSNVNTVALVDGKKLDVYDLDFEMRNQRYFLNKRFEGEEFSPDEELLRNLSMQSIIRRALILNYLNDKGAEISDGLAFLNISEDENFLLEGKFSKQRFESVVRSLGYIPGEYLERVKQDILLDHWQRGIGGSSFITEREIERNLNLSSQTRDISFLKLKLEDYKKNINPLKQKVLNFYSENEHLFQTNEMAKVRFIELSTNKLKNNLSISNEELQEEYQAYLQDFDTTIRRTASHLMINITEDRDEDAALTLAKKLRQKIDEGEEFNSLISEFSEDEGTKNSEGNLGISDGTNFPPEFEKALTKLELNEISQPIILDKSIHLLKLSNIQVPVPESLESIKSKLTEQLQESYISSQFADLLENASDLIFSSNSLDVIGETLSLPIRETKVMERSNFKDPINDPRILEKIFNEVDIKKGTISEVVELSSDRALIFQVKEFFNKQTQPFEEVSKKAQEGLKNELAKKKITVKAQDLSSRLAAGESFSQLAQEEDLESDTYKGVTRNSSLLSKIVLRDLFDIPRSSKGVIASSNLLSGDRVIFRLNGINDEQISLGDEEITTFKNFLFEERKISELSQLQILLEDSADITTKNLN